MKKKYLYQLLLLCLVLSSHFTLAQFQTETLTEYESTYFQVRRTKTLRSDGRYDVSENYYPFDKPSGYNFDLTLFDEMVNRNMVATPVLAKQFIWQTKDSDVNAIHITTVKTTFTKTNNLILPFKVESLKGASATWNVEVDNMLYDVNGNLLSYKTKDGLVNTFTYYDATAGKANLVATHTNNIGQTANYDYYPLIGLKTVKDINGKTLTYTYDSFNRLQKIGDDVGQIKEYSYHYAGQSIENPITATASITPLSCPTCNTQTYLNVNQNSWSPSSSANSQAINVNSNISGWTVTSNATWLTSNVATGTNNATITLSVAVNTASAARTGTVTVTGGGITQLITVNQSANGTATMTITPTSWTVLATGGTNTVTITSNVPWTVSSSASWVTSNLATGSNNGSITLTAQANPLNTTRTATITITGGGLTRTVAITQAAASPYFTVTPTTWTTSNTAGSMNVAIASNVSWTVSSNAAWLTPNVTSGSNSATLILSVTTNSSLTARTGTVTVTGNGTSQTVSITQTGAPPTLNLNSNVWNASGTAATQTVTISSNISWSISSNASWLSSNISSGSNNGSFIVSTQANTTTSTRTGIITVTGSGVTQTFTVTQAPAPYISLDRYSWSASKNASSQIINVTSNTAWSITSNVAWLTTNVSSGANNGSFTINAQANTSTTARTGTITVTAGNLTQTVAVSQAGDNYFTLSLYDWYADGDITSVDVYVNSNVNWSISSNNNWLYFSMPNWTSDDFNINGANSGVFTMYADYNYTGGLRYGSAVASGSNGAVYTINVWQAYGSNIARIAVTEDFDSKEDADKLKVSPNPTDGNFKALFYLTKAEPVKLEVVDAQGHTVQVLEVAGKLGANSITLDLSKQAAGTYILQLSGADKKLTAKIIKL